MRLETVSYLKKMSEALLEREIASKRDIKILGLFVV